MGGSDYEASASVAVTQVSPQRRHKDTWFGEKVLEKQRTGETIADIIREDVMTGVTAAIRRYNKEGIKYNFHGVLSQRGDYDPAVLLPMVSADTGENVVGLSTLQFGMITIAQVNLSVLSQTHGLIDFSHDYDVNTGLFDDQDPPQPLPPDIQTFNGYIFDYTNHMREYRIEDDQWVVDYFAESDSLEHTWFSGLGTLSSAEPSQEGFYCIYENSLGEKKHFFSSDAKYDLNGDIPDIEILLTPVVSLQDNYNNELPYNTLPDSDIAFEARDKVMGRLNVDFEALGRQVFPAVPEIGTWEWSLGYGNRYALTPSLQSKHDTANDYRLWLLSETEIPGYLTPEWNKDYGRTYDDMMKSCGDPDARPEQEEFCTDNPTELDYYNNLIDDQIQMLEGEKNISDAHFGLMTSAKLLDEPSVVALFYTLLPILPQIVRSTSEVDSSSSAFLDTTNVPKTFAFRVTAGTLIIGYQIDDWSLCRRFGTVVDERYLYDAHKTKYKKPSFKIYDNSLGIDPSPLWETGQDQIDYTYPGTNVPVEFNKIETGGIPIYGGSGGWSQPSDTCMELRVQDRPDGSGNPRYLEIRLYGIQAEHVVNVLRDGDHGKSFQVSLTGSLEGIYTEVDYSDVIVFPLLYEAMREVPFFKRERLLRETTILVIDGIYVQEIKWYQKGIFKIVLMIVAVVIAWWFAPAGVSLMSILTTVAIGAAISFVLSFIDNPWLAAILTVIVMVMTGYVDTTSWMANAALIVEATGTYFQKDIAQKMLKLEKEMDEWKQEMNEKKKEYDEMAKEAGMDEYKGDWILYLTSLAPTENGDVFFERALNTDLNEVEVTGSIEQGPSLPGPG